MHFPKRHAVFLVIVCFSRAGVSAQKWGVSVPRLGRWTKSIAHCFEAMVETIAFGIFWGDSYHSRSFSGAKWMLPPRQAPAVPVPEVQAATSAQRRKATVRGICPGTAGVFGAVSGGATEETGWIGICSGCYACFLDMAGSLSCRNWWLVSLPTTSG